MSSSFVLRALLRPWVVPMVWGLASLACAAPPSPASSGPNVESASSESTAAESTAAESTADPLPADSDLAPAADPVSADDPSPAPQTSPSSPVAPVVERYEVEVLSTHPHDPGAFTQGLLFVDGEIWESTGLYGRSTLRRVDPETGEVLDRRELDSGYFAEGLALVGDRLVQITWKTGIALVWDRDSLEIVDQWAYNGEGWGLAFDGERLILSDGSSRLTFRSVEDFRWLSTLDVTLDGEPLRDLNELEWVDGRIYANLWGEERIVRIDPETGRVDRVIEASGLLTAAESRMVDVLNGVAHDPETDTFWITGKFWPKMFRVRFVPAD